MVRYLSILSEKNSALYEMRETALLFGPGDVPLVDGFPSFVDKKVFMALLFVHHTSPGRRSYQRIVFCGESVTPNNAVLGSTKYEYRNMASGTETTLKTVIITSRY